MEKKSNPVSRREFLLKVSLLSSSGSLLTLNGVTLDPDGVLHQQMIEFSARLSSRLENRASLKYLTYENEGHVPFHSYYDGLRFIYEPGIMQ